MYYTYIKTAYFTIIKDKFISQCIKVYTCLLETNTFTFRFVFFYAETGILFCRRKTLFGEIVFENNSLKHYSYVFISISI